MRTFSSAVVLFAILIHLTNVQTAGGAPETETRSDPSVRDQPFWKAKPELQRRLYDERAILVSVRDEKVDVAGQTYVRLTVKGVGLASVPRTFAFRSAQNYDHLKQISSHFRTVHYDATTQSLTLDLEALGHRVRLILKMRPLSSERRDELQWVVIDGDWKGMSGVIGFERADRARRTEISIESVYQAERLPLPKFLMGLVLETLLQKVAEKMRTSIEREYRTSSGLSA